MEGRKKIQMCVESRIGMQTRWIRRFLFIFVSHLPPNSEESGRERIFDEFFTNRNKLKKEKNLLPSVHLFDK